jgi:putative ABC transport system substrate-binding protein
LVPSLNQPGGNVTGMGVFNATLGAKRIELTKELMPGADGIAYLLNPSHPSSENESKRALAAARALGIELHVLNASTEYDLDTVFADVAKLRARVLVVSGEPFFDSKRDSLWHFLRDMPLLRSTLGANTSWLAG